MPISNIYILSLSRTLVSYCPKIRSSSQTFFRGLHTKWPNKSQQSLKCSPWLLLGLLKSWKRIISVIENDMIVQTIIVFNFSSLNKIYANFHNVFCCCCFLLLIRQSWGFLRGTYAIFFFFYFCICCCCFGNFFNKKTVHMAIYMLFF